MMPWYSYEGRLLCSETGMLARAEVHHVKSLRGQVHQSPNIIIKHRIVDDKGNLMTVSYTILVSLKIRKYSKSLIYMYYTQIFGKELNHELECPLHWDNQSKLDGWRCFIISLIWQHLNVVENVIDDLNDGLKLKKDTGWTINNAHFVLNGHHFRASTRLTHKTLICLKMAIPTSFYREQIDITNVPGYFPDWLKSFLFFPHITQLHSIKWTTATCK